MHFQQAPHEEVKIIRCLTGAIHDLLIEIRRSDRPLPPTCCGRPTNFAAGDDFQLNVPHPDCRRPSLAVTATYLRWAAVGSDATLIRRIRLLSDSAAMWRSGYSFCLSLPLQCRYWLSNYRSEACWVEAIGVWGGRFIVVILPPNAGRSKLLIRRTRGGSRLISGSFRHLLVIIGGGAGLGLCDACLGMHTHECMCVIIRGNQGSPCLAPTGSAADRRRDATRITACLRSRRRTGQ
jgi:hypothetical protein